MARILVVDDEPDSLLAARLALAGAGHVTILAADGERALEHLSGGNIDLVVVDPTMPLHDGWAVLDAADKVPVLAVSAMPLDGDPRLVGCLGKPCRPEDLVAAVEAALLT